MQVLTGKDAGKRGTVRAWSRPSAGIVVEKLNMVKRHTKPRPAPRSSGSQQIIPGGVLEREAPLQISNVALVCPACGEPTRVGYRINERTATRCASAASAGRTSIDERDRDPHAAAQGALRDEVRDQLQEQLGLTPSMAVPRLQKITLNMGVGEAKVNSKALDDAAEELAIIAGQRPVITRAKKSIAGFKIREGMPIGCKVTLRGDRMYEFLDRLMTIALPRIRDFRGINPGAFDGRGNFSLGVREQIIFPEINYDDVSEVRGLNVTITTTAPTTRERASSCARSGCRSRS